MKVEAGEILVRGPTVMRGYFADPAASSAALEGGWLRTGDLGALDARGRLTVLSRRMDLIVSGGENVYPAEIEAVLARHPDVLEAAIVPQQDGRWGQVPVAFIVGRGRALPSGLEAHCRAQLAGFKVPKRFLGVGALPRNASGKLDRPGLLRMLWALPGAGSG